VIGKTRAIAIWLLAGTAIAQAPSKASKPDGDLKQVMRGVALPNSNIIFAVESRKPKNDLDWQAVLNAAVAIEDTYKLIMLPGRMRSNRQPVPVQVAEYARYAAALVPAGKECRKAALGKDIEAIGNCTDTLSEACDNCHKVYRDLPQRQNGQ